ncbi:MAG: SRPBCC family protein [Kofleriaceae bacterium]|nr:SRPBCC family protein [Myxococcales bacterium]MCB9562495.1 SRPBCC family protein [Kofleriaceae bacterium]MCB9570746.1 SRPBCC family protein [Kofleriaceae bacterium]
MRELRPIDAAWIPTAPLRVEATLRFSAPPRRLFEALADAEGWTAWFPMMTEARWTRGTGGLGHEREVAVRGLGRVRERFIVWEDGRRFAFTMIAAGSPFIAAMGEDYRLDDDDGGGSRLAWTIGAEPSRLGKVAAPALKLILRRLMAGAGRRLEARLQASPW